MTDRRGIDPGGFAGDWPADQPVINLTAAADPVPAETRQDAAQYNRLARELESKVNVEIHIDSEDEPFDPQDRAWPQRVHYVEYPPGWAPPQRRFQMCPDHVTAGMVFWQTGAWFWRPHWGGADDPKPGDLGLDVPPSVELEVQTEEEAIKHARRRVAWCAAVWHYEQLKRWKEEH